ncbi:hypothetical protein [Helicobacter sp.]|uniref:hypothetical protein n=1 Tax=Helicobacter sp. TaxID=218 RepID=UPI0025C69875|nr:hypothetical protein [Helicobacter sp.]MCI5968365.1 hypothetical protein [Helicobacter sp.]MDY2584826.1 hypothetical protein [Helicobacter sp.]
MKGFSLQMESFLQLRSMREMVLLFVLLFMLGFALVVVVLFDGSAIAQKKALNAELNQSLLALQNAVVAQKNLNMQDAETIHKEIALMEKKIATQEERKRLSLEKFSVYFLKELTDVNKFYGVKIAQENGAIYLEARGKYPSMLNFLESLQNQPKLSLFAMQLYPNQALRDLMLYVALQIQGD